MSHFYVLGIDPASVRNMGMAILDFDVENRSFETLTHYTEVFPDFDHDGDRLEYTYRKVEKIIGMYTPKVLAIELSMGFGKSFVRRNLNESVGVIKLCCARNNVFVEEIAPKHAKLVIAGSGKATKGEMKNAVKKLARLEKTDTEHEADAVAMALCYAVDEDIIDNFYNK